MLFEVAVVERIGRKERLVFGPHGLMAESPREAARAALAEGGGPDGNPADVIVLVRPFATPHADEEESQITSPLDRDFGEGRKSGYTGQQPPYAASMAPGAVWKFIASELAAEGLS